MFGKSKMDWNKEGFIDSNFVQVQTDFNQWIIKIDSIIASIMKQERAILIFFEDQHRLNLF